MTAGTASTAGGPREAPGTSGFSKVMDFQYFF